jgi:hypothetical protein
MRKRSVSQPIMLLKSSILTISNFKGTSFKKSSFTFVKLFQNRESSGFAVTSDNHFRLKRIVAKQFLLNPIFI